MSQRSYFLYLLLLFGALTSLRAQAADTVLQLWPERMPKTSEPSAKLEVAAGIGRVQTEVVVPELHLFRPFGWGKRDAAVIICPGGGYFLHAWDWEGTAFARLLNRHGITAAVLSYRLPAEQTAEQRSRVALADARRAVQLLRSVAAMEGIDPAKIAIMGFSAGGHLAASASVHHLAADTLATDPVEHFSSRPDLSILVYPVISMDTVGTGHAGSRRHLLGQDPDPSSVKRFSLETQVDAATPPTILFHAADDRVVPPRNSIDYYLALLENNVPAALHVYPEGGHGFGLATAFGGTVDGWMDALIAWLDVAWPRL